MGDKFDICLLVPENNLKLNGHKHHMRNFLRELMAWEEQEDLPWPEDN